MHNIHLVGCDSALFDNLAASWRDCLDSFEISQLDSLGTAIDRIYARRPEWVVYCGRTAHSSWEASPASGADDTAQFELLARAVAAIEAHLLVISSDRVLTGPRMFHDENDPPGGDVLAQRLHAIEQTALTLEAARRRVLVVRTNAVGWSIAGDSFAERIWRSLAVREPVELDASTFATPILASDLARLLVRCFRTRHKGLLHIGGAERTSPYRFAQELASAGGFDHRLVRAKADETAEGEPIINTCETSLGSRLVRCELDVSLPLLRECVARFVEQSTNGYRDRLRGTAPLACTKAA